MIQTFKNKITLSSKLNTLKSQMNALISQIKDKNTIDSYNDLVHQFEGVIKDIKSFGEKLAQLNKDDKSHKQYDKLKVAFESLVDIVHEADKKLEAQANAMPGHTLLKQAQKLTYDGRIVIETIPEELLENSIVSYMAGKLNKLNLEIVKNEFDPYYDF